MLEFERDPELKVADFYDLPRSQIRERIMRRVTFDSNYCIVILKVCRHPYSDIIC